jgi:hypothetical protein
MNVVLSELREMGYRVEADGEALAYRWTGPGDPPEEARTLLSELSQHKGKVLALLQAEADRPPLSPSDPLPAYPFCIRSRTLDTEVWIVPDSWRDPVPGPAYTHAEVRALDRNRPTPEALRAIHQVKLAVDGEVVR